MLGDSLLSNFRSLHVATRGDHQSPVKPIGPKFFFEEVSEIFGEAEQRKANKDPTLLENLRGVATSWESKSNPPQCHPRGTRKNKGLNKGLIKESMDFTVITP